MINIVLEQLKCGLAVTERDTAKSEFGLMCLCMFLTIIVGCHRQSQQLQAPSRENTSGNFEKRIQEFLASKDPLDVGVKWKAAKMSLNESSPEEIHRWLQVQQMILNGSAGANAYNSLNPMAIQEFFVFSYDAQPFEAWLRECKERKVFKDPFINQYIDEILENIKKHQSLKK